MVGFKHVMLLSLNLGQAQVPQLLNLWLRSKKTLPLRFLENVFFLLLLSCAIFLKFRWTNCTLNNLFQKGDNVLNQIRVEYEQVSSLSCTYAACRWGSCWPGSVVYLRTSYKGTGVCRAGWACPGGPTDTPHTRYCCHCFRHPMTKGRNHTESLILESEHS